MEILLKDNGCMPNVKDIFVRKDNKTLKIFYGGNGDLYFDVFGDFEEYENGYKTSFELTEDDQIYLYFKKLIQEIKDAEVFVPLEMEFELIDDPVEFHELIEYYKIRNNELKGCYPHSELVKDGIISFYSDSIYNEKANRLIISEIDGKIRLDFFDNPEDYTDGFAINISNSGSKYMPFNICFMRFFNKLHDDLISNTLEENKEKKIKQVF